MKLNRRDFIKKSAATGGVVMAAAASDALAATPQFLGIAAP